ncbi:predicted CRISPR-associated helicase Cas3 [gamma proteobacterium HdN1]|nr:predicted CRISPR-associated helicase Cas3 [gamma proteobacterium HdN1]
MELNKQFYCYWGKASPQCVGGERFHLLPYHSLDVAACGQALLAMPNFSIQQLAKELGWEQSLVESLFVFFLALHDLGKFSRAFQGLVRELSPDLVQADESKRYDRRHDTLGWLLWKQDISENFHGQCLPDLGHEFWSVWIRSVVGHHGKPPEEVGCGGLIALDAGDYFLKQDRIAARDFVAEVADRLLTEKLPAPTKNQLIVLRKHAWRLAGISVLADWLGSNQAFFPYSSSRLALRDYWQQAQQNAVLAISSSGLQWKQSRSWKNPFELFEYLREPTPLQQYAATVELENGPQLFLLEDVTGAGKTEAALILTQRLMQAVRAHGLYFALPSMATANQMYQRVGTVYRCLYDVEAHPSLILAHGARMLVDGFRESVLQEQVDDICYQPTEASASVQCNVWLADNRKKALLAEVGVGTLDQALLAVLPARHQSLRLLGLSGKVLLVDEVHAYDPYMMSLLKVLLTAHARQGGSAILLSATLPLAERDDLLAAFRLGLGVNHDSFLADSRYPLAVRAGKNVCPHACATRKQVQRRVEVRAVHCEEDAVALIVEQARIGRCVCWIRNTVDDARSAHRLLSDSVPEANLTLFHSRYAMGDRLDIEGQLLSRFGKYSQGKDRAGMVLIGTQVLEQSLDFDVDLMISDLAPIDLVIQRAGRLQRHARQRNGDPVKDDGVEQRDAPLLYLLMPEAVDDPQADWYSSLFPKACYVYPDAGKLWRGARALMNAGCIISPGEQGQAGAVRELVEAVYGRDVEAVPDNLQKATQMQLGKDLAKQSQANFNALRLDKGYCIDSSGRWYEDHVAPTRLGDETQTLYLALFRNDELHPLCDQGAYQWEQSSVRVDARRIQSLAPEWLQRFAGHLQNLRSRYRLLEEPAFVLPLVKDGERWVAKVLDGRGRVTEMSYCKKDGLGW